MSKESPFMDWIWDNTTFFYDKAPVVEKLGDGPPTIFQKINWD